MACSKEILDFIEACEKEESFSNIYSKLPNNLIMKIIEHADGGLNTHKQKFSPVIKEIKKVRGMLEGGMGGVDYTGGEEYDGHYVNKYKWEWFNLKSINMDDEDIDKYYNNEDEYRDYLNYVLMCVNTGQEILESEKVLPFREYAWWSQEDIDNIHVLTW